MHIHAAWSLFARSSLESQGSMASSRGQQKHCSDCVNALVELNLRLTQMFERTFVHHITARITIVLLVDGGRLPGYV